MKVCRKCGVELVVGVNWYESCSKKNDYICITCHNASKRERYKKNPARSKLIICKKCGEEKLLYAKGYCYSCYKNEDLLSKTVCTSCGKLKPHLARGLCATCYNKQYYQNHREYFLEYSQGYHRKHRERANAISRQWCINNSEYHKARMKKWHAENREQQTEYRHRYYQEHREEIMEYNWQYYQENPEKVLLNNHRYRARLADAVIEPVDGQAIYEFYNHTCFYCGSKEDLTLDHIVPLNGNGAHVEDNLVIACSSCNSSKRDKPLMKWLQTQPYSLAWLM